VNAHDRHFDSGDIALVRYGDGELTVLRPGRFVVCAVSGRKIPLEALRYWNPRLQEAYAGPAEALARWRELNPDAASEREGA
jgi:hypothetical protein